MAMSAPTRIHAKVHGFRKAIPGGAPRLAGGWDEIAYGGTTEYVRADIVSGMLEALKTLCGPDVSYHDGEIRIPLADHGAALNAMRLARESIAKAEGGAS